MLSSGCTVSYGSIKRSQIYYEIKNSQINNNYFKTVKLEKKCKMVAACS